MFTQDSKSPREHHCRSSKDNVVQVVGKQDVTGSGVRPRTRRGKKRVAAGEGEEDQVTTKAAKGKEKRATAGAVKKTKKKRGV